jgi:hypothetical protein
MCFTQDRAPSRKSEKWPETGRGSALSRQFANWNYYKNQYVDAKMQLSVNGRNVSFDIGPDDLIHLNVGPSPGAYAGRTARFCATTHGD